MLKIDLEDLHLPYREPVREKDLQQEDFVDKFDDEVFAYDCFLRNNKMFIICPPNSDQAWECAVKNININGKLIHQYKYTIYKNKIHKLIAEVSEGNIEWGDRSANMHKCPVRYQGRKRVLYTMQKDNELQWIFDWIIWYKEHHKIDTVILYDNASTKYTIEELINYLNVAGIDLVVESCPYKKGPKAYRNSSWDSDFLQYAMYEHVRYYHCNRDTVLINADIDELVICENGSSIFDMTEQKNTIYLYQGCWVDVNMSYKEKQEKSIRHVDHTIIDRKSLCPNKWTANLEGLNDACFLLIHDYFGDSLIRKNIKEVRYLHYRCITTNWKYKRYKIIQYDPDKYNDYSCDIYSKLFCE